MVATRAIACAPRPSRCCRAAYVAERDALEAEFIEMMAGCPPGVDAASRGEARRITEECWNRALLFEASWITTVG